MNSLQDQLAKFREVLPDYLKVDKSDNSDKIKSILSKNFPNYIFNFGPHAGRSLEYVATHDAKYLKSVLTEDWITHRRKIKAWIEKALDLVGESYLKS